jgi:hypothetical protein
MSATAIRIEHMAFKTGRPNTLEMNSAQLISTRVAIQDCLYLALIVTLSFVLYVSNLGFYSDDWAFLGIFINTTDQSLFSLIQAIFPDTSVRPIQSVYLASLYWLFGFDPFPYHVANNIVFIVSIQLFYLSFRELRLPRLLIISVPSVFALLPHYSTDRFWYAAFQANLSLGLYFLSLYSDLRAVSAKQVQSWAWKTSGMLALLASVFAYEVFAPLFIFNLVLVWHQARRLRGQSSHESVLLKNLYLHPLINISALGLAIAYKVMLTNRMVIDREYWAYISWLARESITSNYLSYGVGLPLKVDRIIRDYPNKIISAGGILIGVIVFSYLYRSIGRSSIDCFGKANWLKLIIIGLTVYGLGYATFLSTSHIAFTDTGINNRTGIAAALGVALSFVGVIGFLSSFLLSKQPGRCFFCLSIAFITFSGFLINNTIAQFWIAASRQQQEVITAVRRQFPELSPQTTLILDGICPYIGPGIVFETQWDVAGMLQAYYRDSTLTGDIVTHKLEVKREGLYTMIYSDKLHYPYSNKLLIYHLGQKRSQFLSDEETAMQYFQFFNSEGRNNCPEGSEGFGTRIF